MLLECSWYVLLQAEPALKEQQTPGFQQNLHPVTMVHAISSVQILHLVHLFSQTVKSHQLCIKSTTPPLQESMSSPQETAWTGWPNSDRRMLVLPPKRGRSENFAAWFRSTCTVKLNQKKKPTQFCQTAWEEIPARSKYSLAATCTRIDCEMTLELDAGIFVTVCKVAT